jgi:hypothetical protein
MNYLKMLTRSGFQAKAKKSEFKNNQTKQKNYMKNTSKPFLALAFFALVFNFISLNANAEKLTFLKVIFGTRSHPNGQGTGCEGDKGVCFIGTANRELSGNTGYAEISVHKNIVIFNIIEDRSPANENEETFYIYEPKEISREDCQELGYNKIILQPGEYYIDKSENKRGTIRIRADIE